jgi:mono/diheme cytochrome c family protein
MCPQSVSGRGRSGLATSWITRHWLLAALVAAALLVVIGAASLFLYAGIYNIAADAPHTQPVYWLLKTLRERSVAARATGVVVPGDLDDPKRIAAGAGQYAEMCSGCHLAPGMRRTEMSRGLYPRAPELRRKSQLTAAEEFWVVKHGVKMTGMPAWGVTHDDELLWDVVAFLRKLPELTADQYQALVKSAPKTHDEMMHEMEMGNGHGNGDQPHQ